jgi:hypothetical protein
VDSHLGETHVFRTTNSACFNNDILLTLQRKAVDPYMHTYICNNREMKALKLHKFGLPWRRIVGR